MNELEAITTPLQKRELGRLIRLVEETSADGRQHTGGFATSIFGDDELMALVGLGFLSFSTNQEEMHISGFHSVDSSKCIVTLLPGAFHRYRHEKRGPIKKWGRLVILKYKEIMSVSAFVISIILLILRVLELAGYTLILE